MKILLLFSILLYTLALPAMGELTDADLDKIRLIVKEEIENEIKPIKADIVSLKTDIVSLKTDVAWIRGKLESVDKQFVAVNRQITHGINVTYGLIALIVAAIAIPQVIMAWRSGKDRSIEKQIETLTKEIETLKKQQIIRP